MTAAMLAGLRWTITQVLLHGHKAHGAAGWRAGACWPWVRHGGAEDRVAQRNGTEEHL